MHTPCHLKLHRKMKLLLAVIVLINSSSVFAEPDVSAILAASDQARGGALPGIVWEIKLISRDGAKVEEPQRLAIKAINQSSVATTLEPIRFKGARLLQLDHAMWLTKPGLSKPIPISARQRMSGQASNGDIAATNYAADYVANISSTAMLDGELCYVLELTAKTKRSTYDRIRYWVSVKRGVGINAEFYSLSGKLLKSARFSYDNVIRYEGKIIPFISKMTITDALINAETTMEFSDVKVQKLSASEFDLGQLQ